MKFAAAQINPRLADCALNTRLVLERIREARDRGADLVLFPELTLVGYPPRDLLDFPELVDRNLECLKQVADAARGIAVVCGFVERNPRPTGRPFFNSAALLREGKIEGIYRKRALPYYDVFEDERYFEAGQEAFVFELKGKRLAITICEDAWNFTKHVPRLYDISPLEAVRDAGVDWVLNLSASPFHLGKPAERRSVIGEAANYVGAPFLYCNQVGGNDDLLFDGGSFVIAPNGAVRAQAAYFEEALLVFDSEAGGEKIPEPKSECDWLRSALEMGVRDYALKSGITKVCLGLSGGIDSSVCAAIAVGALGPSEVKGLALPTRFTQSASTEDARALAAHLGIECPEISIEPLFKGFESSLRASLGKELKGLTLENVQPRIRMTLLMALANEENRLLLNTSNKSELAAGYSTLYGDSAGAIAVLGDLTKHQVYALARHYNQNGEMIPSRVITRAPSAELRENQTDQDSLPPYDVLDDLVRSAIEHPRGVSRWKADGKDAAASDKFARLLAYSEYKRQQFPPILRVTRRAFGRGRRIPLAAAHPWLL